MMHAYPETYLNDAMNNLGNMFDYGLVDLHYDPERFYEQFLTSGVAKQFERETRNTWQACPVRNLQSK